MTRNYLWPSSLRNYSLEKEDNGATELEGLAVVAAVTHFDAYLITHPFIIETDHKALTFLNTADHNNGRLARWAMRLQPYSFNIRYRPGPLNVNADVLSRVFEDEEEEKSSSHLALRTRRGGGGGGGDVMRPLPLSRPPNMN